MADRRHAPGVPPRRAPQSQRACHSQPIADAERVGQTRARHELGSDVLRRVERAARRKREADDEYRTQSRAPRDLVSPIARLPALHTSLTEPSEPSSPEATTDQPTERAVKRRLTPTVQSQRTHKRLNQLIAGAVPSPRRRRARRRQGTRASPARISPGCCGGP